MSAFDPARELERLRALGADGEEARLRVLVRVDPDGPGLEAALRRLRSAPPAPGRDALIGRALLGLGRAEEAERALAAAADDSPAAGRWRGEALLLCGRLAEAEEALEADARAGRPEALALRGIARLAAGELGGASEDAAAARAAGGVDARVLGAMIAARRGRWTEAEEELQAIASERSRRAWPLVLLASVREAHGDLGGARLALREASRRDPAAWISAELARVQERLGTIPDALESAARAVEAEPTVAHRRLKGHLHECWREHELAAAEYARALELLPEDPGLLFQMSRALSCAGRLAQASACARRAFRASPGDESLAAWSLQADLLAGGDGVVRRVARVAADRRAGPALRARAEFLLAYADFRRRRFAAAAARLGRLARAGSEDALARRASFYRGAALALSGGPIARPRAELVLAGLGVDPPYSATAQALRALAGCDVIFNNVMGDEMFEFLRALCADVRPIAYHQDNDEGALSDLMLGAARPGRAVGFVTRGSAIVFGPLGTELLARCRAGGRRWLCLPAVSSADSIGGRYGREPGARSGAASFDSVAAAGAPLDPRVANTVFLDSSRGPAHYKALCRALAAGYGEGAPCLVFDHVIGQQPLARRVGELPALADRLSVSAILHLPARERR